MGISLEFKNIGHALATFFKTAAGEAKKVAVGTANVLDKVATEKTVVEGVSGAVANAIAPGTGVAVVTVEDAAFSLLGAVDAVLKSGGDAAASKLLDAGLDVTAINNAKAVGSQTSNFFQLLKGTPSALGS